MLVVHIASRPAAWAIGTHWPSPSSAGAKIGASGAGGCGVGSTTVVTGVGTVPSGVAAHVAEPMSLLGPGYKGDRERAVAMED